MEKKKKAHGFSVAGATKLNSNLFVAIHLILYFITKKRLFMLQLTSQGKSICDAIGSGRTAETPFLCNISPISLSPLFCENFEKTGGQQPSILGWLVGVFCF